MTDYDDQNLEKLLLVKYIITLGKQIRLLVERVESLNEEMKTVKDLVSKKEWWSTSGRNEERREH